MRLPNILSRRGKATDAMPPGAMEPPAWFTPTAGFLSRLGMEDLGALGLVREALTIDGPSPAERGREAVMAALEVDLESRAFYTQRELDGVATASRSVERAIAAVSAFAPAPEHAEAVLGGATDLATSLALYSETPSDLFEEAWAPYEHAVEGLAAYRPDQAIKFGAAAEVEKVLHAGLVEGVMVEGQQKLARADWSGRCPQCGSDFPLERTAMRSSAFALCRACPTLAMWDQPADETVGFIRFYPRGHLAEVAAAVAGMPFGPESDWIGALLRVVGEFSQFTWSRLVAVHGPVSTRTTPPAQVLELGLGGLFRRRYQAVVSAIGDAIEDALHGAPDDLKRDVTSILAGIGYEILARTYQKDPPTEAVARLQRAMNAAAGGQARSLVQMLEQEASFSAMMRGRARAG